MLLLITGKGRRKGTSLERLYWIPRLSVFCLFPRSFCYYRAMEQLRPIDIVQVINSDLQTGEWQLSPEFVTSVGFMIGISSAEVSGK